MRVIGNIVAFDAEKEFSQLHSDPLDYPLLEYVYDAIINGGENIEDRIQAAAHRVPCHDAYF